MKTQEEIFQEIYRKYRHIFPNMLHGSGGLPDTKGVGTSDVDICVRHNNYDQLLSVFPNDTDIDTKQERTIYKLKGYAREVNIYISNGDWWDNGYKHRKTEIALNNDFPELSIIAFMLKTHLTISTEEAWAKVLALGENYNEKMFDTQKILKLAEKKMYELELIRKRLPV